MFFALLGSAASAAPNLKERWTAAWGCSPQTVEPQNLPPAPGLAGNTLRQVIRVSLGGKTLRLRLSNEFGSTPLHLESVHVALPDGPGGIKPETDHPILFHRAASVDIRPGAFVLSDALPFPVTALESLAVTLRATAVPAAITGHPGSRATSYIAAGDQVSSPHLASAVEAEHWYLLDGLDVETNGAAATVATLGDSITDGRGSTTNGNTRWPDFLAQLLAGGKLRGKVGVLNDGIGGNRILTAGLGPTALARFDRDVLGQAGVRWLVIFEGVNDIGSLKRGKEDGEAPHMADDLILAYGQMIERAHTHALRVYGATITAFGQSFYDAPLTEGEREKVNQWIRTSGAFDAVVDFDQATRDPAHPGQLAAAFDSGDHLHLNSEGYRRMASAIDLRLFAR